jgi:hypothetical protein
MTAAVAAPAMVITGKLLSAVAGVALAHLSHARHGGDPIPALAFCPNGMTRARTLVLQPRGPPRSQRRSFADAPSMADVAAFLHWVPLNLGRIGVWPHVQGLPALFAAVARHPCHRFVTHLHCYCDVSAADAAALVGGGGLPHVTHLKVCGDGAVAVAGAASSTLRSLSVPGTPAAALDLTAFRRLVEIKDTHGDMAADVATIVRQ